ncbi:Alpha/Beta hydrolase protein [Blyttiomyces helicus]|uniref:Alpha/Beta hydrolase protein n=1 Tax=Blyttiomyces helicus TaxID=388810 RepID=A0A4P9W9D6_9FUNG|nr:Alpha/Beta hydrolase protein [Blyttiomyces helicus]|eukprot:RKO88093.1 Alpha/Beta hydrolase protein [Blyttiomyces helicus]
MPDIDPNPTVPTFPPTDRIKWKPCGRRLVCGMFGVPLNHSEPHGHHINLALIKYPAPGSQGSIFVNPGGPGGSGVDFVRSTGVSLSFFTGGNYDIIGVDPRGIGASNPISCFPSAAGHRGFDAGREVIPRDAVSEALYASRAQVRVDLCAQNAREILPFVSTAAFARDLDLLRQAVGSELLNFYGLSYGTFVGAVYSQMFPDKVGKMVLDGVMDPVRYSGDIFDFVRSFPVHMDTIVESMGTECQSAGPDRCAMATRGGRRPGSVYERIRSLIARLDASPLPVPSAQIPGVVTGADITTALAAATYSPDTWPVLLEALADLERGDGAKFRALTHPAPAVECPLTDSGSTETHLSVVCLDSRRNDTRDLVTWREEVIASRNVSWVAASTGWTYLPCRTWGARAQERYEGPWNRTTKNKILLISSTLDPVTPIESAQTLERLLGNSAVLLTHEGYGHTSLAQPSICTVFSMITYFSIDRVPDSGARCVADNKPFPATKPFAALDVAEIQAARDVAAHVHAVAKGARQWVRG